MAGVRAHGVAGLVHAGRDEDHAAQRALAAGHGGDALVVDAVLEIHDDAVGAREVGEAERGGPLGVVGFHGHEDGVERLREALHLVQVERLHRDHVIAAGAGQAQALALEPLHVLGPLVHQRHVVAALREQPAHDAADRAGAQDPDAHRHGAGSLPRVAAH